MVGNVIIFLVINSVMPSLNEMGIYAARLTCLKSRPPYASFVRARAHARYAIRARARELFRIDLHDAD